jgi:hypothetical protein
MTSIQPPKPMTEQLDQGSVNNHQCPMRSATLVIVLVSLGGCYTYPPGTESGARDGVGFTSPQAADQEFPGAGYGRRIPNRGVIPYGEYRFVIGLPACNSPTFSIRLPPVEVDDALQSIDPVTFHADTGRFVHVIPIA